MSVIARIGRVNRFAMRLSPLSHSGMAGVLAAFLRRDLADGGLFRASLVMDLGYGLVNLLTFMFISRVLHHPGIAALGESNSYFDFVAVGLAYLLVVQATCTQMTSRIQEQQRSGTLEASVAAPVPPGLIAVGMAGYPVCSGLLRSLVYLVTAAALLGLDIGAADWPGLVVMLFLGALAAIAIGISLAAVGVAFAHGGGVGKVVVMCLALLSGVYFPVVALPAPLRWIGAALPTRLVVDGLRSSLAGGAWLPTALLLVGITAVMLPASAWLFVRAIDRSRRTGTLARG